MEDAARPPLGARPSEGVATVELVVEGMHCPSCVALIEETLRDDPAVHAAAVDLDAARASVTYDPSATSVDDVCTAVARAGYAATAAPGEPTP